MAKVGNGMAVKGKSGQSYSFAVYTRDTEFKALGALYLMSKRTPKPDGGGSHQFLYIGQTGDLSNRPLNHHKKSCFDKCGADHVSVYLEPNEKKRLEIETDLIQGNDLPCNG